MELVNGKVVTVTQMDLESYLYANKQHLEMIDREILQLQEQRASIIAEMESLTPKEEGKDIITTLEALKTTVKEVQPIIMEEIINEG